MARRHVITAHSTLLPRGRSTVEFPEVAEGFSVGAGAAKKEKFFADADERVAAAGGREGARRGRDGFPGVLGEVKGKEIVLGDVIPLAAKDVHLGVGDEGGGMALAGIGGGRAAHAWLAPRVLSWKTEKEEKKKEKGGRCQRSRRFFFIESRTAAIVEDVDGVVGRAGDVPAKEDNAALRLTEDGRGAGARRGADRAERRDESPCADAPFATKTVSQNNLASKHCVPGVSWAMSPRRLPSRSEPPKMIIELPSACVKVAKWRRGNGLRPPKRRTVTACPDDAAPLKRLGEEEYMEPPPRVDMLRGETPGVAP